MSFHYEPILTKDLPFYVVNLLRDYNNYKIDFVSLCHHQNIDEKYKEYAKTDKWCPCTSGILIDSKDFTKQQMEAILPRCSTCGRLSRFKWISNLFPNHFYIDYKNIDWDNNLRLYLDNKEFTPYRFNDMVIVQYDLFYNIQRENEINKYILEEIRQIEYEIKLGILKDSINAAPPQIMDMIKDKVDSVKA